MFVSPSSIIIAEESGEPTLLYREIFFFTRNAAFPIFSTRIKLTAVSVLWDKINQQGIQPITSNYNNVYYEAGNNEAKAYWNGYDFVTSQGNDNPPSPVYTYGLYKVTFEKKEFENYVNLPNYFYLDYRDTRCPQYSHPVWHGFDIWIRYDYQNQSVKITQRSDLIGDGDDGEHWITVLNGDYIPIWEFQQQGNPITTNFQFYWNNSLSVFKRIDHSTSHIYPFLAWGPIPDFSATGYKIYRRIYPTEQQFSLIAQVNNNTYTFGDFSLSVSGSKTAYYKVAAFNGSTEPQFTNEASIQVSLGAAKYGVEELDKIEKHEIVQSLSIYPNPFNPITTINYNLQSPGNVRVQISNTLGQKVHLLVDSYHSKGMYSVRFDASTLPTGLYYCTLSHGGNIESKKLLYLK